MAKSITVREVEGNNSGVQVVYTFSNAALISYNCVADQCCEECKTCPPGWTQFKDHCYVNRHASKDWADAEVL